MGLIFQPQLGLCDRFCDRSKLVIKEDRELLGKFLALASYLESHGVQIDGIRNLEKTIAEWDGAASISRLSIQETMELFQKGEV
jgi:hypothetical protein